MKNGSAKNAGKWIEDLFGGVGRYVRLETSDGVRRSGKLSGIRTKDIKFNGASQAVVTELELNGDPADTVSVNGLASIAID